MALFSDKKEAEKISVKGNQLLCRVCGHDTFFHRKAQLNTAAASLFNVDWANKSAYCYICSQCTNIEWFLQEP